MAIKQYLYREYSDRIVLSLEIPTHSILPEQA